MATSAKNGKSETKITRISASDKAVAKKPAKAVKVKPAIDNSKKAKIIKQEKRSARKVKNPLAPIGRYLKGSWDELRQVRWPDRKSTWGMTGALIAFTLFFVVVILLLDAGFSYLFKLIIGKS